MGTKYTQKMNEVGTILSNSQMAQLQAMPGFKNTNWVSGKKINLLIIDQRKLQCFKLFFINLKTTIMIIRQ